MAKKNELLAILKAVDQITPTTKKITKSVRIMHKSLRDIGNAGGELMRKIGVPAFLSFGAVTYGAIRATKAALDYAGSIQDAADRTGASVEGYQALTNMLGLVGGTAEDAEMAFTKFNKGIAEAAGGGNKDFASLMKKIHIPLKDAKGQLVGLETILPQLAAGFAKNKNPAIQTRMAVALFGKSGTKLIPVMKGLTDGSISLADAMKTVVDKEAITDLDNMGDSITALGTKTKNTLTSALAKMVPVIQPIIDSMSVWLTANQDLIKSEIVKVLTEITNALKEIDWKATFAGIKETVSDIRDFIKAIGGVKTLIYGMGLAWIAGPIAAIGAIAGAIWRLGSAFKEMSVPAGKSGAVIADSFGKSASAGMIANLGALARAGGLLTAAALVGWTIGTVISDHLLSHDFKDRIGRGIARVLSAFGNAEAKQALINEGQMAPPVKTVPSYGQQGTGGLFTSNAEYAAMARNKQNLVGNNQAKLNGEINVNFKNAPPGMRIESSEINQSDVGLNMFAGYRTLATRF